MVAITIDDVTPRAQYTATAGQTAFSVPFSFYADADVLVYQTLAANTGDDDDDLLTIAVDYTLTGAGLHDGGVCTLATGAAVGDKLTLMRAESLSRSAAFPLAGAISSTTVDLNFNHLLLMIQQLNVKLEHVALKYNNCAVVDETKDKILPVLAAKETWRMNTAGDAIEAMTVEESGEAATLRADLAVATVVTDGAMLIGYNDGTAATTVHVQLLLIASQIAAVLADVAALEADVVAVQADVAAVQALVATLIAGEVLINAKLAIFTEKSHATNGYQKLYGGLILQWGTTAVQPESSTRTITLPYTYPTANLSVTASYATVPILNVSVGALGVDNIDVSSFNVTRSENGAGYPDYLAIAWFSIGY